MTKRIIACLDITNNQVVKGTQFKKLKPVGNIEQLAYKYYKEGADELVLLNISKTKITTISKILSVLTQKVFIPIIFGGNIQTIEEVKQLFTAGIDKVCLNSTLYYKPQLVKEIIEIYGSQSLIASIDVKLKANKWLVYIDGGKKNTHITASAWVKKTTHRGVGEILLTSIDHDGKTNGYNIKLIQKITNTTHLPIIASGGMGAATDIITLFKNTNAAGALIASYLHIKRNSLKSLKTTLNKTLKIRNE
ncbi:imidazole glycerol phosphate synthase subunit HisF [Candidatus Vidania fulgoroideae]|uniref:imidazole glycerol-phosphate synthase n=1 Tax=Candidatus Vidania fulgoroideorum TaxID=881286 RepID=A0A974X712_9PROT|nr:imidazole glycerol phosphate synthase subunit HisF [Candidatus Vidania fulgoroideae]